MTALVGVLIPKRTYRDSKSSFDISDCLITAGARHCCRQLGLRREVRPRKEVLRQAHQRAIRDTGVLEFFVIFHSPVGRRLLCRCCAVSSATLEFAG